MTVDEACKRYEAAAERFYKADEVSVNASYQLDKARLEALKAFRELKKAELEAKAQSPQESRND
jgi:hypothetical protein